MQGMSLHSFAPQCAFFAGLFPLLKSLLIGDILNFPFAGHNGDSSAAKTNIPCAAQSITVSHSALLLQ